MNGFESWCAKFFEVLFRLDHTLVQSTFIFSVPSSLLQIDSTGRGLELWSISLLYIIDTDVWPYSGAIQSNMGCEGRGEFQGTPYALKADLSWKYTKYEEAGRVNLVLKSWMEQRPAPSWLSPQVFIPRDDQEGWINGWLPHNKLCHKGVLWLN